MKARTTHTRDKLPETFAGLNALHPLRPINDKVDFENAQQVADQLAVLDQRIPDQDDYLETLSMLMEKYEVHHAAINTRQLDPVDTLRYLMDGRGMTASDLGRLLGERSLGAAVLRRDRQLSKRHIRALCAHFGVGPELFFKP